MNPILKNQAVVKDYLKSNVVLIRGILFALIGLMNIIVTVLIQGYVFDFVRAVGGSVESQLEDSFTAGVIGGGIGGAIPFVLVSLGYILMNVKSRNPNPQSSPSAGITILNVFAILGVIGAAFVMALSLLVGCGIIAVTADNASSTETGIVAVGLFVMIVFYAYALIDAISAKMFFGSLKKSVSTSALSCRGAKFYGIMNILKTALYGIYAITMFASIAVFQNATSIISDNSMGRDLENNADSITMVIILSLLPVFAYIAISVMDALIAFGYAKHIKTAADQQPQFPDDQIPQFGGNNIPPYDSNQNSNIPPFPG